MATKANSKPCDGVFFRKWLLASDVNSESCQASKMEFFAN